MTINLYKSKSAAYAAALKLLQERSKYMAFRLNCDYMDEWNSRGLFVQRKRGLGVWLGAQRRIGQGAVSGKLSPAQIHMLDEIGMVRDKNNWRWEYGFEAVQCYDREHRDLKISIAYRTEDGVQLSEWLRGQKKNRNISAERKQKLESIGAYD